MNWLEKVWDKLKFAGTVVGFLAVAGMVIGGIWFSYQMKEEHRAKLAALSVEQMQEAIKNQQSILSAPVGTIIKADEFPDLMTSSHYGVIIQGIGPDSKGSRRVAFCDSNNFHIMEFTDPIFLAKIKAVVFPESTEIGKYSQQCTREMAHLPPLP